MERKVAKARAGEMLSQRHAEAVGAVKNSEETESEDRSLNEKKA